MCLWGVVGDRRVVGRVVDVVGSCRGVRAHGGGGTCCVLGGDFDDADGVSVIVGDAVTVDDRGHACGGGGRV